MTIILIGIQLNQWSLMSPYHKELSNCLNPMKKDLGIIGIALGIPKNDSIFWPSILKPHTKYNQFQSCMSCHHTNSTLIFTASWLCHLQPVLSFLILLSAIVTLHISDYTLSWELKMQIQKYLLNSSAVDQPIFSKKYVI